MSPIPSIEERPRLTRWRDSLALKRMISFPVLFRAFSIWKREQYAAKISILRPFFPPGRRRRAVWSPLRFRSWSPARNAIDQAYGKSSSVPSVWDTSLHGGYRHEGCVSECTGAHRSRYSLPLNALSRMILPESSNVYFNPCRFEAVWSIPLFS
jgi:hypothetical protein